MTRNEANKTWDRLLKLSAANQNRTKPEDACPKCGERDMDQLVWIDQDSTTVECQSCGVRYAPATHGVFVVDVG